jgi:phosphate transport system substrate-binding protein
MTLRNGLRAIALATLGMASTIVPAVADDLRVGGTGAVNGALRELAPAFLADTGITLRIVASLGTTGANLAVADGKLGLAIAGRDLKENERAKGLKIALTFRTPFGFATSREGPDGFKSSGIAEIYGMERPLWGDGTPILVVLRPSDESDNIVIGDLFPGVADALLNLRKRRDLSLAATDQDNADMGEKLKGSLISATVTQVITEKRNLRFLSIDGIAANLENLQSGAYPYGKTLYVVVPSTVSPQAEAFIAFLAKPATELLLRKASLIVGR